MKKIFLIVLTGIIGFYSFSLAWNEFTYENARKIANEYIANSSFDENWKDQNPTLSGEGKYFYTESETPSYIEFKISCDKNPDCGFIMVNFDGDDVAIPIASTSGNTPSEVLSAKNESKIEENKLYYFSPFEQYAENKRNGNISSIDPQDDFGFEVSGNDKFSLQETKIKKKNALKEKIESSKKEAKIFKNSAEFKKIKQELKEKKQTNGKEEVSFKYLDLAIADVDESSLGYTKPATSNILLSGGMSSSGCIGITPCYSQFKQDYPGIYGINCSSGCSPTAVAILFGYYDVNGKGNLIPGTASRTNNNDTISLVNDLRIIMGTKCTVNKEGGTDTDKIQLAVEYAKNKGYIFSTSEYSGNISTNNVFIKVKSEINNGRPIIVMNKTHSMVASGYNSTSGLPIVRLNMGWGGTSKIKGTDNVYYYTSDIDYNMNSMYYNNTSKTPITYYTAFNIK